MLRCPICLAVLTEPGAKRCPMCATNLRRHPPEVLGQSTRVAARLQKIDLRAMEADDANEAPPGDPYRNR